MSRFKDAWYALRGKRSAAGAAISSASRGVPQRMAHDFETFVKEGLTTNPTMARCVNDISTQAATIPVQAFVEDERVSDTPYGSRLETLFRRPNVQQSQIEFVRQAITYRLLSGEIFTEAVNIDIDGGELWNKRPDRMYVIPGDFGMPSRYEFKAGTAPPVKWPVNPVTGDSDILHVMIPNPINDWRGLSPVNAAAMGIDSHNESSVWNLSALQHGGRPPILMSIKNSTGQQRDELRTEIPNMMGGSDRGRDPLIVGGDVKVDQLGYDAVEMDWLSGKNLSVREICWALDYPSFLLGLPGDSTYNNQMEARMFLWENTILSHFGSFLAGLNRWLAPRFGVDGLHLRPNLDAISSLNPRREKLWDLAQKSEFLSINEKRELVGFETLGDEGNVILVDASRVPLEDAGALFGDGAGDDA